MIGFLILFLHVLVSPFIVVPSFPLFEQAP
jgi:hypothetical protein